MKVKVKLIENKLKRRNINPMGKKFKKTNYSCSSFFKPKTSRHKSGGKFYYIYGRTNRLAPQCFHWKKEPFKPAAKENGRNFAQSQHGGKK